VIDSFQFHILFLKTTAVKKSCMTSSIPPQQISWRW